MVEKGVHDTIITECVRELGAALEAGEVERVVNLFVAEGCYWRDLVSMTWNIVTMEGQEEIRTMLENQLKIIKPINWTVADNEVVSEEEDGITTCFIRFETDVGRGCGHMRVKNGKIFTLLTTLVELKGYEESKGISRPLGARHGYVTKNHMSWKEEREREEAQLGTTIQPYCVIIGGGQGAIGLGARLRQLGVPTIIVEKNQRPGDSWRNRYKSLCLHDPVYYDHLPFLPFPDNWPIFSPKDKIADWLEMYTKVFELNYWTESTAQAASYDEATKEWTVVVQRKGEKILLRPKQLVLATGMSALWEVDAEVTMIQRSSTHIVRSDTLMEVGLGALYSEKALANGITTEKADLLFASVPYRIMPSYEIPKYKMIMERDKAFYEKLQESGFKLDFGDDGSGLFMKYLRRGSGYYIDVGACSLVCDGEIKVKYGQVNSINATGMILDDGSHHKCDLIVYATGYESMNGWVADLIGDETAKKVGKVWGLGSDTTRDPGPWVGELRNMWKPTQQEALWFHGGNLHQSRHYSQFLAIQLKARMEGLHTIPYRLQGVHHQK